LETQEWEQLIELLEANQARVPRRQDYWQRLQTALGRVGASLGDHNDPLYIQVVSALPDYTGYSKAMIRFTLNALELSSLSDLPQALEIAPTRGAAREWALMPGLPDRICFYLHNTMAAWASRLPGSERRPLYQPPESPDFIAGFCIGNVPGTSLRIALLAGAVALEGGPPPSLGSQLA
jgi:hypothetical protein